MTMSRVPKFRARRWSQIPKLSYQNMINRLKLGIIEPWPECQSFIFLSHLFHIIFIWFSICPSSYAQYSRGPYQDCITYLRGYPCDLGCQRRPCLNLGSRTVRVPLRPRVPFWKFRLTFWPGFYNYQLSSINRILVRQFWDLRPAPSTEFRYAIHGHSGFVCLPTFLKPMLRITYIDLCIEF